MGAAFELTAWSPCTLATGSTAGVPTGQMHTHFRSGGSAQPCPQLPHYDSSPGHCWGGGVPGQNGANLKCCDHTDAQTCPDGEGEGFGPFPGCFSPEGGWPHPSCTLTSVYRSNFSCIEYRSHFYIKTLLGTSLPPEGFQSLSSLDGNQARGKLVPPGACDRSRAARRRTPAPPGWLPPLLGSGGAAGRCL